MADMTTVVPAGDGGLFGMGGGGLIGGLILGSLLRNNGNLFGGDGNAAAGVATAATVNTSVQTSAIQTALGDIKAAIPLAEAQVQTALGQAQIATQQVIDSKVSDLTAFVNSMQSNLTNQINANTTLTQAGFSAMNQNLNAVDNNISRQLATVEGNLALLSRDISAQSGVIQAAIVTDGDKTRALLTSQYEATLNRQLSDANAQIVALQNRQSTTEAARGVEVTTNNNINQMQQQQQQQQQFGQLYNAIWGLAQSIRSSNEAINVGSGTLTANPMNTNTNIR